MTRILKYFIALLLIINSITLFSQSKQKNKDVLDYIDQYKDAAMTEMVKYKIPASITLAQGILESGSGKSKLARQGNNHFGIKCHSDWTGKSMRMDDDAPNECFRVYKDAAESYRDHSKFLKNSQRYASLFELKITDYKGWAKGLKKAGYATLPTYANVLISYIETYDLTQYDQMVVKGKFKPKKKKTEAKPAEETKPAKESKPEKPKTDKPAKKNAKGCEVPVLADCPVVEMTADHHYIRENFGVKFIITKSGDNVKSLAKMLKMSKHQLVKYNDISADATFSDGEVLYIGPKRRRAAAGYNKHVIQSGETMRQVSRLYAVKLQRLYTMNGLDENSVLQIGQEIKLR